MTQIAEEFRNGYQVFKCWADTHDWFIVSETQLSMSALWAAPNGNMWVILIGQDGDTITGVNAGG